MKESSSAAGAVVVGVDGSASGLQAVQWAMELAQAERRPLVLVHAVDICDAEELIGPAYDGYHRAEVTAELTRIGGELLETTRQHVSSLAPDLEVREYLRTDDAREVLLDTAAHGAAVVVVGSHGHGPVLSMLLGSVSAAVARAAECPVVVVRPHRAPGVRRGVLVGSDSTAQATGVLETAFLMASERSLPLTVLHSIEDPTAVAHGGYLAAFDHDALVEAQLETSEALVGLRQKYPDLRTNVDFAAGPAWQALLRNCAGMDLLVVGRHERSLLDRLRHGASTTMHVIEHAACPVLVVPAGSPTQRDRGLR